jgi:hypothetical protein
MTDLYSLYAQRELNTIKQMEHDDPKLHANPILETKKMVYKGNMGELINNV